MRGTGVNIAPFGERLAPACRGAEVVAAALGQFGAHQCEPGIVTGAACQRGDITHAREQARLALDIRGDADSALALAKTNWAQQKEPADALLLVRAALAAGRTDDAEPVRQLVREHGWADARLVALDRSLQR